MEDYQEVCNALQAACAQLAVPCHVTRQLDGQQAFCTLQLPGAHNQALLPLDIVCCAHHGGDGSISAEQGGAGMALQCLADAGLLLPDALEQALQRCRQCWQPPPPPPIEPGRLRPTLVFLAHGKAHATHLGPPSALLTAIASACGLIGPHSPAQLQALPSETLPLEPARQYTHLIELPAHADASGNTTAPLVFQATAGSPQAAAEAASAYLLLHLHSNEGLVALPLRVLLEAPVLQHLDPSLCHACHALDTPVQQQPEGEASAKTSVPKAAASEAASAVPGAPAVSTAPAAPEGGVPVANEAAAAPMSDPSKQDVPPVSNSTDSTAASAISKQAQPALKAQDEQQVSMEQHLQPDAGGNVQPSVDHIGPPPPPLPAPAAGPAAATAVPATATTIPAAAANRITKDMFRALSHLAAIGHLQPEELDELRQIVTDVSEAQQQQLLEEWRRAGVLPEAPQPQPAVSEPQEHKDLQQQQQQEQEQEKEQTAQQEQDQTALQQDEQKEEPEERHEPGQQQIEDEPQQRQTATAEDDDAAEVQDIPTKRKPLPVQFLWVEAISSSQLGLPHQPLDLAHEVTGQAPNSEQQRVLEAAVMLLDGRLQLLHSCPGIHVSIKPPTALSQLLRMAGRDKAPVEWLRQRCCGEGSCSLAEAELQLLSLLSSQCGLTSNASSSKAKGDVSKENVSKGDVTSSDAEGKGSKDKGGGSSSDTRAQGREAGAVSSGEVEQQLAGTKDAHSGDSSSDAAAEGRQQRVEDEQASYGAASAAEQRPTVRYVVCSSDYLGTMTLLAAQMPTLASQLRALPHIDVRAMDMLCQHVMPKARAAVPEPKGSLHATQRAREAYCRLRHYHAQLLPAAGTAAM